VREPERRLYRELLRAGLAVQVKEVKGSSLPIYDINDLQLHLLASDTDGHQLNIRFRPRKGAFFTSTGDYIFHFDDLVFDPAASLAKLRGLMV